MRTDYLPYCRPDIDERDIAAVVKTLQTGWITTGPLVREFEQAFLAASGAKHAIALSSCTAGLHLGLLAAGVAAGDEVIMPSLSFVAGAQCARQIGAKPVFCDVDPSTLCLSVETIDAVVTARTKAIMPMHYAGRPAPMNCIAPYARERGIAVIEDAALAVGMLDDGKWAGASSDAAAFSFYATKNVTTAEGGMLITNDDALAEKARILSLHGMDKDAWKRYMRGGSWQYDVVATGYKYNMPDVAAALGIAQLQRLPQMQQKRADIAEQYLRAMAGLPGIQPAALGSLADNDRHSWCVFSVLVDKQISGVSRDNLISRLGALKIGTSVHYIPTHLFSAYADSSVHVPNTDAAWQRLISLPLYPSMTTQDVDDVIDALHVALDGCASVPELATS